MASDQTRLQIRTQHCAFCNHLLLATTRDISTLPRRGGEAKDQAIILPLELHTDLDEDPENTESTSEANSASKAKHATLLLATTIPDRRATLIRREDGIEKRILLRCGRCRVVVGYYLDRVHWSTTGTGRASTDAVEGEREDVRPPAVYLLPGSLLETEKLGVEGATAVGEMEWRGWSA
ncbi:hypothetical protein N7470_004261 [Penicillium chermesinum]|nr:hypothetical protein N7470_004261 [Penicillium chermesinum]